MSDELPVRAEREAALYDKDGEFSTTGALLRDLATRVRELEAELDARAERDATVRDLIKRLRERAERAEAERDALRALLREAEPYARVERWGKPGCNLADRILAALKAKP